MMPSHVRLLSLYLKLSVFSTGDLNGLPLLSYKSDKKRQ